MEEWGNYEWSPNGNTTFIEMFSRERLENSVKPVASISIQQTIKEKQVLKVLLQPTLHA